MAMITLVTGKPRQGKTAFVVQLLLDDPSLKGRKLFSNINGLQLPHEGPPEGHTWEDMHDWLKWPENVGSVVVFDEVQNLFPARSNGARMSENVLFLNVHGHYAIDMFFITQGTKIIDVNLKETVNKHIHIAANKMGSVTRFEWNYCANNPLAEAKNAIARKHVLDNKVFDYYKSAEAYTENKPVKSKWYAIIILMLCILPVVFGIIGFIGYKGYQGYKAKAHPTGAASSVQAAASSVQNTYSAASVPQVSATASRSLTPAMFTPTLTEKPESKPLYDGIRAVKSFERVAGCINTRKNCTCYSDQATELPEITPILCRKYVAKGLPFNPYKAPEEADKKPVAASEGPKKSILAQSDKTDKISP